MVDESAEGVSVGKDEVAKRTEDKLSFWEAADRYSRSHQKYKETYMRIINILERRCKDPGRDMIGVHVSDVINLLYELTDLSVDVWFDYMRMRTLKEERNGVQHSETYEGATGDSGTGHTSRA